MKFFRRVPFIGWTALTVMSRNLSLDVATLTRCRTDVVTMSQHHSDFLIGFSRCRDIENVMSRR